MKVACVLSVAELSAPSDLILFPEGVTFSEMQTASHEYPKSFVAGAVEENGYSRGVLLREGVILLSYFKVLDDGRTKGSGDSEPCPVFDDGTFCIGLLVCKDIDEVTLARRVTEALQSSSSSIKALCIPADMGSEWLNDSTLFPETKYRGFNVILCNQVTTRQARCKSFITDRNGKKLRIQQDKEPLYAELS